MRTEENWSIRMYYLILLMGYWNPEKGWINFLSSKGFDYNPVDVEGYHMGSLPRISIDLPTSAPDQDAAQSAEAGDRYRFLNESDIVGGLAAVEEHYRSAIARCESALLADLKAFLDRQTSCLDIAYQCLGGRDVALHRSDLRLRRQLGGPGLLSSNLDCSRSRPDTGTSWLNRLPIWPRYLKMRKTCTEESRVCWSLLETSRPRFRFRSFRRARVRRQCTPRPSLTWAWQYLRHPAGSTATGSCRWFGSAFPGRRFETALDEVNGHVHDQYEIAWKRMRLAVVNHQLHIKDKEPLTTYASLEFKMIHGRLWLSTEEANLLDAVKCPPIHLPRPTESPSTLTASMTVTTARTDSQTIEALFRLSRSESVVLLPSEALVLPRSQVRLNHHHGQSVEFSVRETNPTSDPDRKCTSQTEPTLRATTSECRK